VCIFSFIFVVVVWKLRANEGNLVGVDREWLILKYDCLYGRRWGLSISHQLEDVDASA
jgi:hypothetical protein